MSNPLIEWELKIPVIKNPLVWFQTVLVVGIGASFFFFNWIKYI